jgi:hypothetical protein
MEVKAIQERWPLTYKKRRSFLGLVDYYHHFLQDFFSKVATTLPDLLGKKWLSQEWDELCHQAFGELKSKLFLSLVLKFTEFDKPYEGYTRQVILYWWSVDARWMAIAYESMKLNSCQRRQPTHEK